MGILYCGPHFLMLYHYFFAPICGSVRCVDALLRPTVPPILPPHSLWAMPAMRRHIFEHVRGQVGSHRSHAVGFTGHGHVCLLQNSQIKFTIFRAFSVNKTPHRLTSRVGCKNNIEIEQHSHSRSNYVGSTR